MPRTARLKEPGDFHHVMSHGIDTLDLFRDEDDCAQFITLLDRNMTKYDCHCYGFSLMPNHYHLLLRPGKGDFSKMMQTINSVFARYVNKKRGRRGYVFRDRFKSIPTTDWSYIKNLIMYIHSNPLRAGIVKTPEELEKCSWTSHRYLTGTPNNYKWLKNNYMLGHFMEKEGGENVNSYMKHLKNYLAKEKELFNPWNAEDKPGTPVPESVLSEMGKERAWVAEVIEYHKKRDEFRAKVNAAPNMLKKLLHESCGHYGISCDVFFENILSRKRDFSRVIKLFSHWAINVAGVSGTIVGSVLSRNSRTVLRAAQLGREECADIAFPVVSE